MAVLQEVGQAGAAGARSQRAELPSLQGAVQAPRTRLCCRQEEKCQAEQRGWALPGTPSPRAPPPLGASCTSPSPAEGSAPAHSTHPAPSSCTQPGPSPAAALGALGPPRTMSCRAGAAWVLPHWEEQPPIAILEDAIKMPLLLQLISLLFKCIHRSCALAQSIAGVTLCPA